MATITVKWTDSVDVPADSYDVLWGTAAGQETNLANSTPIAAGVGTYSFAAPTTGNIFIVVKSVQGTLLSGPSNEVEVTVSLQPPTAVTAVVS